MSSQRLASVIKHRSGFLLSKETLNFHQLVSPGLASTVPVHYFKLFEIHSISIFYFDLFVDVFVTQFVFCNLPEGIEQVKFHLRVESVVSAKVFQVTPGIHIVKLEFIAAVGAGAIFSELSVMNGYWQLWHALLTD